MFRARESVEASAVEHAGPWGEEHAVTGARGGPGGQGSFGPVLFEAHVELWRGAGGGDGGLFGGVLRTQTFWRIMYEFSYSAPPVFFTDEV